MKSNVSALAVAAVIVVGCRGAQTMATVPTTTYVAAQTRASKASSSYGDLLYITSVPYLTIMSYPGGKVISRIPGNYGNSGVCADPNNGNVFVVNYAEVDEYAHGSTSPFAKLTPPSGQHMAGCTVDPTTGNLAVPTYQQSSPAGVLIWVKAQGYPTWYSDRKFRAFGCNAAYDDSGNLFLNANNIHEKFRLVELQAGHSNFKVINYPKGGFDFSVFCPVMQWDGKYLVFQESAYSGYGNDLFQVEVRGHNSKIVNTMHLLRQAMDRDFELYDGVVLGFYQRERNFSNYAVALWHYPKGGKPFDHFYGVKNGHYGNWPQLTVSVAPSR